MSIESIVLITAGVLTALEAGLFYSFSVAIIPALRKVSAKEHISVFQSININIENPLFAISFIGSLILLSIATYLYRETSIFWWLLLVTFIQYVLVNGMTVFGNIPINQKLAQVNVDEISNEAAEKIRYEFQKSTGKWMIFHNIRTISAIIATTILFAVCISI